MKNMFMAHVTCLKQTIRARQISETEMQIKAAAPSFSPPPFTSNYSILRAFLHLHYPYIILPQCECTLVKGEKRRAAQHAITTLSPSENSTASSLGSTSGCSDAIDPPRLLRGRVRTTRRAPGQLSLAAATNQSNAENDSREGRAGAQQL